MKKQRAYLWVHALLCVAFTAALCMQALALYRQGLALRVNDPTAWIYTRQAVADRLGAIAPLLFGGLGVAVAGWLLGVRDENQDRPVADPAIARDLLCARVAEPSAEMRRERRRQRGLRLGGWVAAIGCMVPVGLYLVNPAHFQQTNLELLVGNLLRAALPWTALAFAALCVSATLNANSVQRELSAAKAQLQAEKKQGVTPPQREALRPARTYTWLRLALLGAAVALIIAGIANGSMRDVLIKAITICTECVGLG